MIHAQGTARYKIGITTRSIEARLAELNSSQSAFPLALIDSIRVKNATAKEKELHAKFKQFRRHGEWFEFSPRLVNEVRQEFKKITGKREYLTQNQKAILWGIAAFVLGFWLVVTLR
ncbi:MULTISPECIES: GIY-YIG nuclease family protein [unclassified Coleofasciculus]|uniref:GIY-YIG nuclease family protein n=1 Tax=unclassified Coleofasciculus TaxID=2692782 RepID=UPI0018815695|nr:MULTISPECIES: GIY-YIG nuclease family protein [unclassified Coleofasciculus]MBE9126947.1 GIY-YIG nuclease family protein [Coleofasciculus sp. LEGE 07081]MBE9150253.1 GIY-YIG nuclease family protein [Coleofasciculus sp. LEGE 07092]